MERQGHFTEDANIEQLSDRRKLDVNIRTVMDNSEAVSGCPDRGKAKGRTQFLITHKRSGCSQSQCVRRIAATRAATKAGLWPANFDVIWQTLMERHCKQAGTRQMVDFLKPGKQDDRVVCGKRLRLHWKHVARTQQRSSILFCYREATV